MGARLGGWVLVGEQKKELDLSGAGAREHGSPGPWAAVMGSTVGFTFPPKVSSVPSNPTTSRRPLTLTKRRQMLSLRGGRPARDRTGQPSNLTPPERTETRPLSDLNQTQCPDFTPSQGAP